MRQKSESEIQKELMVAASMIPGCRLWRNNTGMLYNQNGTPVSYGLCPGSSDLIGFRTIVIGPEDVGKSVAQFLAIEVKSATGKVSESQSNFVSFINTYAGKAFVARSVGAITSLSDPL